MKKKLSLQDFADILAQREDIDRKAAEAFVRSFFDIIEQGLQTDKFVKIKGFGTFKLVAVSERESVNINTGERFQISGHTKVSFTPDATMKELVNRPFAHFEAVDLNDDTDTKEFEVIDEEMEDAEAETEEAEDAEETDTETDEVETTEVEVIDTPIEAENANEATTANNTPTQTEQKVDSEPNVSSAAPVNSPIEIITDESPTTPTTPPTTTPTEPQVTPTTSVTEGNEANNSQSAERSEATTASNTHANNNHTEEEIVVTAPTPISHQATNEQTSTTTPPQAPSSTNSDPTNATVGYTYNEVPSPRKRNWWKTLSLILLVMALMVASYFVGYYRMLCPTCDNYIFGSSTPQPTPPAPTAAPQPVVQPIRPAASVPDSTPSTDTAQKSATTTSPSSHTTDNGNAAESKAKAASTVAPTDQAQSSNSQSRATATTQRPKTHCVGKGENIYRIARKYYGSDSYAEKIIKANNLKDANTIVVGMELKLP